MIILGLTGSIGMGKSTTAQLLARMNVPVHDADRAVHQLLRRPAIIAAITRLFPAAVVDHKIDRAALGRLVFHDSARLQQLEHLLHPLVRRHTAEWLKKQVRRRERLVVLDIPLLFEGKRERGVDGVLVVSASAAIQKRRVLARKGMDEARFKAILARQVPDREKRRRADVVIPTGQGRALTWRLLRRALKAYNGRKGRVWRPGWEQLSL